MSEASEGAEKRTLREWRVARQLEPVDLASKSKVSLSTITEVEANHRLPSMATAQKLADALGITISDIRWPRSDELNPRERRTKTP